MTFAVEYLRENEAFRETVETVCKGTCRLNVLTPQKDLKSLKIVPLKNMIVQVECKQVFQTKRALLYAEVELFLKSKGGELSLNRILLENLTDDAIALLYVTKFVTISLYLTKLYVT